MTKKIAYCIPSLYIAGGMERVLTLKANYLADQAGYEIILILTDGKNKAPWYSLSPRIRVIHLDINFDELWSLSLPRKISTYLYKQRIYKQRLTRCLMEIRPDITVTMMRREINFINRIPDGSRKIGEIHVCRSNYRTFDTDHTSFLKQMLQKYWTSQLLRKIKQLETFVVLCQEDREQYPELHHVQVIPNPLSFYPEKITGIPSRQVIAVGRYSHQKGYDFLLKAWQQVQAVHPDYHLLIHGDGDRTPYLRLARELKIENTCRLEGAVNNVAEKYQESYISVLSSRFEGFGVVLTESMACGVPPVAFTCPCGPKDIITNGQDGFLVENGNIDALAEKICILIENPELRKQMSRQARLKAQQYQLTNIMQQWLNIFDSKPASGQP